MDFNYTLRYRTFDSLLADVKQDLRSLSQDLKVEPNQLIKIALKASYDLGLRIHQTKELVLDIEGGRVRLPEDFFVMNYALLCGSYSVTYPTPQGTNIQEVVPEYKPWPDGNTCDRESIDSKPVCLTQCGTTYSLVQIVSTETRTYDYLLPIKFKKSQHIDCDCPNLKMMCLDEAYIKDNFIYTSFETGKLYINYQGSMTNEDGDLLVVDHPMINEYYEYALKQRIIENLILDGDNTLGPRFELITQQLRMARNNALSIVRTPNFKEMYDMWKANRKAMYSKYYDMFKSNFHPYK